MFILILPFFLNSKNENKSNKKYYINSRFVLSNGKFHILLLNIVILPLLIQILLFNGKIYCFLNDK